jgi:hypothetical protein
MEKQGAEVVAYDLSDEQEWDVVPYRRLDDERHRTIMKERKDQIRKINNGFWLAHKANGSQAKVVYGNVYEVPEAIGDVDVSVFGSVLLHVRDPFLALQKAARLTRETIVVTDVSLRRFRYFSWAIHKLGIHMPVMWLAPDYRTCQPWDTWWTTSPDLIKSSLGVLGFEESKVSYAHYPCAWGQTELFTLVAHRTCQGAKR